MDRVDNGGYNSHKKDVFTKVSLQNMRDSKPVFPNSVVNSVKNAKFPINSEKPNEYELMKEQIYGTLQKSNYKIREVGI